MNFKEIKELIEILDQSNLTEINIEDNKGSVVNLKEKETEIVTPQVTQQPTQPITHAQIDNETQQNHHIAIMMNKVVIIITIPLMHQWLVHFINHLHQMKKHMFK